MARNEVKVKVTADTAQAEAAVGGLGSKMGGILKAGAIAAGIAIIGTGAAALSMAANFETAFAEVLTLFDAPKKQIDALRDGVRELSRTMGIDATEATKALYQAISAGVAPGSAIEFLAINAKLAIGGVTDLATAVDLTTTILNAFGLSQQKLADVSDIMFTAVVQGKTTIAELAASMFQVAGSAAAANVPVEQVAVALATLAAAGTPTKIAATSLRAAFVELGKAGTIANDNFKEIAGVGFRDFMAQGGDVVQVMELLKQKAEEDGVAVGDLFGSMEAGQEIGKLAGKNLGDLTANMADMEDRAGATDAAFETMNETFERQFAILKENLKFVMMDMALAVLPALTDAVIFAAKAFQLTTEVIGQTITFLKENRVVAIGLAAALAALLAPAFVGLTAVIITATLAALAFIAAQLAAAAPLILFAAAVAALAVGIVLLVEHWDQLTAKVEEVVAGLQKVPGQLLDLGRAMAVEFGRGLAAGAGEIWAVAKSIVRGIIFILNPFNWVFGSTMTEVYKRQGDEAGSAMVDAIGAAFARVSGIAGPLLEPLRAVRDFIGSLQSEMARLLGLGTVEGTDEQLRLAELRLELLGKEGDAEAELERIQRDRLERLKPLEEQLAEARAQGHPQGRINMLERQIKAINDEETAIERGIRVLKEQIETLEKSTDVRRLETEILSLRGKAADATLLSDEQLRDAAEGLIETIGLETATFADDAALIHATFIPALDAAADAEDELGEATSGVIGGEGGLEDLQAILDEMSTDEFQLEMFDAADVVDTATAAMGNFFSRWAAGMKEEFEIIRDHVLRPLARFFVRWGDGMIEAATIIGTGIADALIAGFKGAWNAAANLVNAAIPNQIDPLGKFGPAIDLPNDPLPLLRHQGGVVPGLFGQEVLIQAQAGEVVQTADEAQFDDDRGASGGGIVIHELHLHGPLREALADLGLEVR